MGIGLLGVALLAVAQGVVPRVDCGVEPKAEASARCAAVVEAMAAAISAEGLSRGPGERCGETAGCVELIAKTQGPPVYFELRDAKGVRLIAHTDVTEYRANHKGEDALLMAGFLTVAFLPIALEFRTPTSRADEEQAWRIMARRVLRQGLKKGQRFLGPSEVRGQRWSAELETPRVGRLPRVEELQVIKETDYTPIDAETDEAREARYGASLAVAALVEVLDGESNFDVGNGKLKLIAVLDGNGRFRSFLPRENPALFRNANILHVIKRAAFKAQGVPLPGLTRIEIPLTLRRLKGK